MEESSLTKLLYNCFMSEGINENKFSKIESTNSRALKGEKIKITKIPLNQWQEVLNREHINPDVVKWFAGEGGNTLSKIAGKKKHNPEDYYLTTNAPLEMGYVIFPEIGEKDSDEIIIKSSDNLVRKSDQIHLHSRTSETYLVLKGSMSLRVGVKNAKRKVDIDNIPDRYEMDGFDVNLKISNSKDNKDYIKQLEKVGGQILTDNEGEIYASMYEVKPNVYHIITYVSPGTKLLLIKTAKNRQVKNWNDKQLHPAEEVV